MICYNRSKCYCFTNVNCFVFLFPFTITVDDLYLKLIAERVNVSKQKVEIYLYDTVACVTIVVKVTATNMYLQKEQESCKEKTAAYS